MERYRVNASIGGLVFGEIIEIDPTDPHWQPLIEQQYIEPDVAAEDPVLPPDQFPPER